MEHNQVHSYRTLGREDDNLETIRAQISHILCQVGNRAVIAFIEAMKERRC